MLSTVGSGKNPPYYLSGIDAQVLEDSGWGPFVPLDAVLRAVNFDPSGLLPGSITPYVRGGSTLALPYAEVPWGLKWRTDAFAAAKLAPPTDAWTLDDLKTACVALQSLARTGVLKDLEGALYPFAFPPPKPSAGGQPIPIGSLIFPGLWQAFVWGFGGSIVTDGKFRLTDPVTVQAIEALVALQEYAVPRTSGGHALAFQLYQPGALPAPWKWARLPRFPVDPVVTTVSYAQGMVGQPGKVPNDALAAAVTFMLWLYEPSAVSLMAGEGAPPVVASTAAQRAYWTNKPDGGAAVGDWSHFRDCYGGFPSVTPHAMYDAITSVLYGGTNLPAALAAAEQAMNSGRGSSKFAVSVNPTDL